MSTIDDFIKKQEAQYPVLKCWGEMYDIKEKLKRMFELKSDTDEYMKLCADIREWAFSDEEQGR
jgi:hypothetical protein